MLQVDWKADENRPTRPKLLGTKVYNDFPLEEVVSYIDWNPFFQVGFGLFVAPGPIMPSWVGGLQEGCMWNTLDHDVVQSTSCC